MNIVRIEPSFREKIWGCRDLAPWYSQTSDEIGEVWFDAGLPVLVKFLFTSQNLSVQLHPGGIRGKTEMWHILRADRGARIALGFRTPVTHEHVRAAAISGEIIDLLQWFPVSAGETYFVPPGTVHAIGGGIALCEIQQNRDITYRLYDYGRGRELHLEESLAWLDPGVHPGPVKPDGNVLVRCDHFITELLRVSGAHRHEAGAGEILVCASGSGTMAGEPVREGEVLRIPEAGTAIIAGSLSFLVVKSARCGAAR